MVAGELLIGALSVEHHLEPGPPSGFEHAPLGKDAGAAVGLVLMPGDPLGQGKGVLEARIAPMRDALRPLDDRLHERAFIDALYVVAGADAVYSCPIAPELEFARHQAHDRRAVEPAREATADRDIRAQVNAHGLSQQRPESSARLALVDGKRPRLQDAVPTTHRRRLADTPVLRIERGRIRRRAAGARPRRASRRYAP